MKLILPALTEATSTYWRPIKYSLFPPLGLATLAAYLDPDIEIELQDEHVQKLDLSDQPDLVIIQVYITNAYRAYQIADHYRARGAYVLLGGLHVTSLPEEAAPHADTIFIGPGEDTFPRFLQDYAAGRPLRRYVSRTRTLLGIPPVRRDLIRATAVPCAELDCRFTRLSAPLHLLLQGRVLRGRALVLHAAGGRGIGRDRAPTRSPSVLSRRSSAGASPFCQGAVPGYAGHGPHLSGGGDGGLDSPRRPDRRGRGGGTPQYIRRIRDALAQRAGRRRQAAEPRPELSGGREAAR